LNPLLTDQALDGIKVLDLTHHIAGPYCAKLLADFGAEVVKVEKPGSGDPARAMGPFYHDEPDPEKSLLFAYLNTNKLGITLDLKSETGKNIVRSLVRDADVLVENFSPRVMPSLGLSYETLRLINPSLVMVSISNFGQSGPYQDYKAADIIAYALGGLMYIFGENDREPLKHALHQAQFKAGTNAASAAAIAILHQQMTGKGQWVDVSVHESVATGMRDTTSLYTYMGGIRKRQPPASGTVPRAPMETKDGYVVPIFMRGADWPNIVEFLKEPQLEEERFATQEGRVANAGELQGIINRRFRELDKFETFRSAHEKRFPFGVVQSPEEVLQSPHFEERGYFEEIDHPETGKVKYPGRPFVMSRTPWQANTPAPAPGQHNHEIYCERLGYSRQDLLKLRASGVI
jgi:crotonobetainyl-CoA:carnitine CoA-transferase CaiB-like acyl-CoA transferase